MNHDLSRQADVWALNLSTGDKFTGRKWRDYYNIDKDVPKYGNFEEGCIIGILIDMDRGILNFFKDGYDLGQAFIQPELKRGTLYPFIQTKCLCEISIFHPFVYPAYRPPLPPSELANNEMMLTPDEEIMNATVQEIEENAMEF